MAGGKGFKVTIKESYITMGNMVITTLDKLLQPAVPVCVEAGRLITKYDT